MNRIILITLFFISCSSNEVVYTESGKIENGTYYSDRLDWKIDIPENFKLTTLAEKEEEKNIRNEVANNSIDEISFKETSQHLIGFYIDTNNSFSAKIDSLSDKEMSMEEYQEIEASSLNSIFSSMEGLIFDQELITEKIGDYNFYVIKHKFFVEDTNQLILNIDKYNTRIKSNIFSITISYNSEDVNNILYSNFKNSLE